MSRFEMEERIQIGRQPRRGLSRKKPVTDCPVTGLDPAKIRNPSACQSLCGTHRWMIQGSWPRHGR